MQCDEDVSGAQFIVADPALYKIEGAKLTRPGNIVTFPDQLLFEIDADYLDEKYPERRDVLRAKWRQSMVWERPKEP